MTALAAPLRLGRPLTHFLLSPEAVEEPPSPVAYPVRQGRLSAAARSASRKDVDAEERGG